MWIGNVLANRYASAAMREVWAAESKIISERRLWLAVLAAQHDLGVDFGGDDPAVVIKAYQSVVETWRASPRAKRSPGMTSRRGSRSSMRWPVSSTCIRE